MLNRDLSIFDEEKVTTAPEGAEGQTYEPSLFDEGDESIQGNGSNVDNTEETTEENDTTEKAEEEAATSDTDEETSVNDEEEDEKLDPSVIPEEDMELTPEALTKLLNDLSATSDEVDDAMDDLEEVVDASGDAKIVSQLSSLKEKLAQMQDQISDLEFQNSSLKRQADSANTKLLDKIGETEWLELNKGALETLDNQPELKLLVKYYNSDDDASKNRVVGLIKDIYEKFTGENIDDLIKGNSKGEINAALLSAEEGAMSSSKKNEPEEYNPNSIFS